MTLRGAYNPLRPDLDGFLFSQVGDEHSGIPLSMISALAQLGLDPREEADRLSLLSKREAVEQLARLIAELPGRTSPLPDARRIAGALVERLPKFGGEVAAPAQIKGPWRRWRPWWPPLSREAKFSALCIAAAAVALLSFVLHGGFWFP